eukprot:COSAG01_NODE_46755_length_397_cov_0.862416_1_plen_54_part_10
MPICNAVLLRNRSVVAGVVMQGQQHNMVGVACWASCRHLLMPQQLRIAAGVCWL